MSRYRKVDPRIWNDQKFRDLSDNGKLVFFMLLTHPSMTALGAMRATMSGLAEELAWPVEAFREAFSQVLSKDMAEYDAKACLVSLPKFIKYNQPESPNVVKAWTGSLDLLPESELKNTVLLRAKAYAEGMTEAYGKAFTEAFAEALAKAMPNQEQKQKPKPKQKNPPTPLGGRFAEFWNAWPDHKRKVARAQCAAKWESKDCEAIADQVIAAVEAAKKSEDWLKAGGDFIPAPLVWLNQARWEANLTATVDPLPNPGIAQTTELFAELAAHRAQATQPPPDIRARLVGVIKRVEAA